MSRNIAEKYRNLKRDFVNRIYSGDIGDLSLVDLKIINELLNELIECHSVKTLVKKVADYFKVFGFKVVMDFDRINFVIVEA